jgi:hypothetical protein
MPDSYASCLLRLRLMLLPSCSRLCMLAADPSTETTKISKAPPGEILDLVGSHSCRSALLRQHQR